MSNTIAFVSGWRLLLLLFGCLLLLQISFSFSDLKNDKRVQHGDAL